MAFSYVCSISMMASVYYVIRQVTLPFQGTLSIYFTLFSVEVARCQEPFSLVKQPCCCGLGTEQSPKKADGEDSSKVGSG